MEGLGLNTNKGGLKHVKINPKVINIYPIADESRYPVRIFELYQLKLTAGRTCNTLYSRPLKHKKGNVWYADAATGINKLCGTVRELCDDSGLNGYFTNHSTNLSGSIHFITLVQW